MEREYDEGNVLRVTGTFTLNGSVTDPTDVFLEFKKPGAVAVEYEYGVDVELVKSSTGVYYVDLDLDTPGRWLYRFFSTGTGQAARPRSFYVKKDPIA